MGAQLVVPGAQTVTVTYAVLPGEFPLKLSMVMSATFCGAGGGIAPTPLPPPPPPQPHNVSELPTIIAPTTLKENSHLSGRIIAAPPRQPRLGVLLVNRPDRRRFA